MTSPQNTMSTSGNLMSGPAVETVAATAMDRIDSVAPAPCRSYRFRMRLLTLGLLCSVPLQLLMLIIWHDASKILLIESVNVLGLLAGLYAMHLGVRARMGPIFRAARRALAGDYSARVPLRERRDELTMFEEALNEMSAAILRSDAERRSLYESLRLAGGDSRVTAQRLADEAARHRLLMRAIESVPGAVMIADVRVAGHPLVYANSAFTQLTGYTLSEAIGHNPELLYGTLESDMEPVRAALQAGRSAHIVLRSVRKNGELYLRELNVSPVFDEAGQISHVVSISSDVTEHETMRQELAFKAQHDSLTGLPNRQLLEQRIQDAIAATATAQSGFLVMVVGIDRLKLINENVGYAAGDVVLRGIAERLRVRVRASDILARLDGDKFVLVIRPDGSSRDAITQRIMSAFLAPFELDGLRQRITGSIGVSAYPRDGGSAGILIRKADVALYQAKGKGRNIVEFYAEKVDAGTWSRFQIENRIQLAIERHEFRLQYQPQFDALSGRVRGIEALIRWHHPERGVIQPAMFIPIAEESGQIIEIGRWVLAEACSQAHAWRNAGLATPPLSVNVSALQFRREEILDLLQGIRGAYPYAHGFLEVEVTESLLMDADPNMVQTLHAIRALGMSIAIDDFGTGYSSLAYLKNMPIDRIKIDRSFISDVENSRSDATICATIINLAHALGVEAVAEGVETDGQVAFLRAHGCDSIQGFIFSRAVDADAMGELLAADGYAAMVSA